MKNERMIKQLVLYSFMQGVNNGRIEYKYLTKKERDIVKNAANLNEIIDWAEGKRKPVEGERAHPLCDKSKSSVFATWFLGILTLLFSFTTVFFLYACYDMWRGMWQGLDMTPVMRMSTTDSACAAVILMTVASGALIYTVINTIIYERRRDVQLKEVEDIITSVANKSVLELEYFHPDFNNVRMDFDKSMIGDCKYCKGIGLHVHIHDCELKTPF